MFQIECLSLHGHSPMPKIYLLAITGLTSLILIGGGMILPLCYVTQSARSICSVPHIPNGAISISLSSMPICIVKVTQT